MASAFVSIFEDPIYSKLRRRPVWMRMDKCKEFLNSPFQASLRREGIQFHVFNNPDVKCSVVKGAHRTIRIGCTNISPIKIYKLYECFAEICKRPKTTRFSPRWAWQHLQWPIQVFSRYGGWWMPRDVTCRRGGLNSLRAKSSHPQRKEDVSQGRRTKSQHRELQYRKGDY